MTENYLKDIHEMEADEGFKMTMTEFKGATINALQYINKNVEDLQKGQISLQTQLNNQKLLASLIGGATGIIAAILNPFKK